MNIGRTRLMALALGTGAFLAVIPQAAWASDSAMRCPAGLTADSSTDFATGELSNGLQYVIDRKPGYPPSIMLAVNAGNADQTPDQVEAAHLIEHIGLAYYADSDDRLNRMVRDQQIEVASGTTGSKTTFYTVNVLPGTEASPKQLLGIVEYWLKEIPIAENFERERGIVTSEVSRTATPSLKEQNRMSVQFFGSRSQIPFMFLENQKGYRNILQLVAGARAAQTKSFYRKWYRPDLATVVITGDVDVAEWRKSLEQALEGLANPPQPSPRVNGKRSPLGYIDPARLDLPTWTGIDSAGSGKISLYIAARSPRRQRYADGCAEQRAAMIAALAETSVGRLGDGIDGRPMSDALVGKIRMLLTTGQEDVALDAVQAVASLGEDGTPDSKLQENGQAAARAAIVALRTAARFGVDQETLASVKRDFKRRLYAPRSQEASIGPYSYMIVRNGGNLLYRAPSRGAEIDLIDGVTADEVNAYLREKIDVKTLAVALIAPKQMHNSQGLRAAIDRGIAEGMKVRLQRPVVLAVPAIKWPGLPSQGLSTDTFVRDGDMVRARLPGGQILIIRKVANPASFSDVVMSFGTVGNFDTLLGRGGMRHLNIEGRAAFVPSDVDPAAFKRFAKDNGVRASAEIRPGMILARVRASAMNPEALFQAGRSFLNAIRGAGTVTFSEATALRAEAGPLSRVGVGAPGLDQLPPAVLGEAIAGFSPQYVVISGDFEPDAMIPLAARYLADLPELSLKPAGRYRASTNTAPQMSVADTGKLNAMRHRIYSMEVSDADAPAMEVVSELLYLRLYAEIRTLGAYDFFRFLKYRGLGSAPGHRVMDLDLSSPASQSDKQRYNDAIDRVTREIAAGRFDESHFRRAVRGALARRYQAADLAELNDMLIEDLAAGRPVAREYQDLGQPILKLDLETVRRASARFLAEASVSVSD